MAQNEPRNGPNENCAERQTTGKIAGKSHSVTVEHCDPEALTPHPRNEDIYGDGAPDWFVETIDENSIEEPIMLVAESHLVDEDTEVVISGHRRIDAAKQLGLEEVPVIIRDPYESELAEREGLIEHNKQRKKSFSQKMREAKELIQIERERAKKRQQRGKAIDDARGPQDFEEGETYELVADRFDRSKGWLRYSVEVWDAQNSDNEMIANRAENLVEQIDRGETSPYNAYQTIKTRRKQLDRSLSTTESIQFDGNSVDHEDHPPAQASWLVDSSKLKRILEVGSVGLFDWLYLEISPGRVQVLQSTLPGATGRVVSYCSFGEEYFEQFELARDESLKAFIDAERIYTTVERDDSDTVQLKFRADDTDDFATGVEFVGDLQFWSRTNAIDDQSELEALLERIPVDIHNRFHDQDILLDSGGNQASTRIETRVSEVMNMMWVVNHTPGDDDYPVTVEDGEFRFFTGDETSYMKGRLDANVSGPEVSKRFDFGFDEVFNTLSGKVELQTAPAEQALLAVVQRNDDHVIRHVIAPA
ncbi:ParB/RepB/Spo0J family partition protein [Halapricum desulfuricans]|uniref:tRNA G10 N-methylase Trm11 n=1 Tax=Halapricum desulfuricans TaxID=2841257 RepID=A0A897NQ60_9EURY|nr:ParB N-terminal domain-containing protein [Halapricum desulfuricans]QSG14371.1 tRNA G10 N-methylase Trm11 [Halapricum desulfuricans]